MFFSLVLLEGQEYVQEKLLRKRLWLLKIPEVIVIAHIYARLYAFDILLETRICQLKSQEVGRLFLGNKLG